ncbi:Tripartite motif containing 37 [Dimargaris cristalligena]|uniref:B box-type domain-containing protein n=1 Tax=Dimargaris cristalligena TaxID=215637 RepID=A0A4P9ZLP8_9FUNG|nr:Tripartite motif containing 37 [Dimargaris cristalligena]RKP34236.1 hypothetical protein BJ085DRAFT_34652 [Dimargaris cristalligena]|eukprot:RKP34236.1 hypothetical protein BJ085DRAFT_34652 [Dimargaris cristalligena]
MSPPTSGDNCPQHDQSLTYFCLTCRLPLCSGCDMLSLEHRGHSFYKIELIYPASLDEIHRQSEQLTFTNERIESELATLDEYAHNSFQERKRLEQELHAIVQAESRSLSDQASLRDSEISDKRQAFLTLRQRIRDTQSKVSSLLDHHTSSQVVVYKEVLHETLIDIVDDLKQVAVSTPLQHDWKHPLVPHFEYDTLRIPHFSATLESRSDPFLGLLFLASGTIWRLKLSQHGSGPQATLSIAIEMVKGRAGPDAAVYHGSIEIVHPDDQHISLSKTYSAQYHQSVARGIDNFCTVAQLQDDGFFHSEDDGLLIQYGIRPETYIQKDRDQTQYIKKLEQSLLNLKQQVTGQSQTLPLSPPNDDRPPEYSFYDRDSQTDSRDRSNSIPASLPSPTFEFNFGSHASLHQVLSGDSSAPTHNPFERRAGESPCSTLPRTVRSRSPLGGTFNLPDVDNSEPTLGESDWSFLDNSPQIQFPGGSEVASPTETRLCSNLSFGATFPPPDSPEESNEAVESDDSDGFPRSTRTDSFGRRATTGLIHRSSRSLLTNGEEDDMEIVPDGLPSRFSIDTSYAVSSRAGQLGSRSFIMGGDGRRVSDMFGRAKLPSDNSSDFQDWLEERRRSGGKGAFSSAAFRNFHEAYDREKSAGTIGQPPTPADPASSGPNRPGNLGIPTLRRLTARKSSPFPLNMALAVEMVESRDAKPRPPPVPVSPSRSQSFQRSPSQLGPKPTGLRRQLTRNTPRKPSRAPSTSSTTKQPAGFYTPILMRSLRKPGDLDELMRRQKEDPSFQAQLLRDHKSLFQRRARRPLEGDPSDDDRSPVVTPEEENTPPVPATSTASSPSSQLQPPTPTSAFHSTNRIVYSPSKPRFSPAKSRSKGGTWGKTRLPTSLVTKAPTSPVIPTYSDKAKQRSRATSLGNTGPPPSPSASAVPKSLAATLSPRGGSKSGHAGKPPIPLQLTSLFRGRSGTRSSGSTPTQYSSDGPGPRSLGSEVLQTQSAPRTLEPVRGPQAAVSPLHHKSRYRK